MTSSHVYSFITPWLLTLCGKQDQRETTIMRPQFHETDAALNPVEGTKIHLHHINYLSNIIRMTDFPISLSNSFNASRLY